MLASALNLKKILNEGGWRRLSGSVSTAKNYNRIA